MTAIFFSLSRKPTWALRVQVMFGLFIYVWNLFLFFFVLSRIYIITREFVFVEEQKKVLFSFSSVTSRRISNMFTDETHDDCTCTLSCTIYHMLVRVYCVWDDHIYRLFQFSLCSAIWILDTHVHGLLLPAYFETKSFLMKGIDLSPTSARCVQCGSIWRVNF